MNNDPLFQERLKKLNKLKELGVNPYPERFERSHFSAEALELGEKGVRDLEEVTKSNKGDITLAGRMLNMREFGKLNFVHLQDDKGRIQLCFMDGQLDDNDVEVFKLLGTGDIIGVSGELFQTKHGETTLMVNKLTMLSKALRGLPEKWHGVKDQETQYRQRYLQTIMDPEAKKRFEFRFELTKKIRDFYYDNGFIEIESPVLENISSGAAAKPFQTHHNAFDIDVYLRIAAGELWHKTAVVGGFEKVFEVSKCFRNEGIDPSHLQEFTMIEHYAAFWNYEDNMDFMERMFEYILKETIGTTKVTVNDPEGNPAEVDFKTPWPRIDYAEQIKKDSGIDIHKYDNAKDLLKAIEEKGIKIEKASDMGYGNLVDHLYKKVTRPKLIQPAFVMKHPIDTKPLARKNDEDPKVCDSFQLLVNGWEIINAYGEIVDPLDQRERFEAQAAAKASGDEEAMSMNEEYLLAMEHGMPPMSGMGMGVDRLVSLLTQQDNLKDVVLFPLMKPQHGQANVDKVDTEEKGSSKPKKKSSATGDGLTVDIGISYDEALALAKEHIKNPNVMNHSLEAEAVMRGLAKHFGADEEAWGILGLLHDIDWDPETVKPEEHGMKSREILSAAGVTDEAITIIESHIYGFGGGVFQDRERSGLVQHALACGETITGLIHAGALVRPDKSVASMEVKSIKKKFKDKSFAAGVDRDVLREAEKIGLEMNDLFQIALDAIKPIADQVGL